MPGSLDVGELLPFGEAFMINTGVGTGGPREPQAGTHVRVRMACGRLGPPTVLWEQRPAYYP